jgi:hypothetical protein
MRADKNNRALTTEMPIMRAVLLQLVFSIAGLNPYDRGKPTTVVS